MRRSTAGQDGRSGTVTDRPRQRADLVQKTSDCVTQSSRALVPVTPTASETAPHPDRRPRRTGTPGRAGPATSVRADVATEAVSSPGAVTRPLLRRPACPDRRWRPWPWRPLASPPDAPSAADRDPPGSTSPAGRSRSRRPGPVPSRRTSRPCSTSSPTRTHATVKYTSGGNDLPVLLNSRLAGGAPPDVAFIPQPGVVAELARRACSSRSPAPPPTAVSGQLLRRVAALGTVDGQLYGVYFKVANKSVIWYRTDAFDEAGVAPPTTWDELHRGLRGRSPRPASRRWWPPAATAGCSPTGSRTPTCASAGRRTTTS